MKQKRVTEISEKPIQSNGRGAVLLGRWAVGNQQEAGSRQGHRNDTEEDPCPGVAIEQPALEGRGDRRGCDDRSHREQGLQDRLLGPRIGKKDDRLAPDEEDAAGQALDDAKRDQQVQPSRDGGKTAGRAHDEGRPDDQAARVDPGHQPRSGDEPDHLESGVADIQPGELIRGGIGVADDVGAPERQDGAGDRLRQTRPARSL